MGSNTKQRPASTSSLRDRSHGIRLESATAEHSKSFDSVFSPSHSRMQSSRSPKPSTSDSDVFSAGSTYDIPRARPHLATSDTIPESSPYSPPTVPKRSSPSPKEAWVLNSQSYESLPGKGKPKVPTKPRPLQSTKGNTIACNCFCGDKNARLNAMYMVQACIQSLLATPLRSSSQW